MTLSRDISQPSRSGCDSDIFTLDGMDGTTVISTVLPSIILARLRSISGIDGAGGS